MADLIPRTPEQLRTQHAVRGMLDTDGWRAVERVLFVQLAHYDGLATNPQYASTRRLDALARKSALLNLLQQAYKLADMPSPLDAHYLAYVTSIKPPEMPVPDGSPASTTAKADVARAEYEVRERQRRRAAGSVA